MRKEQMAGTRFDPIAHAKAMREAGFWVDKSYDEFLQGTIARTPDKLALIADRADRSEKRRFTYAELGDRVARAAASLKRLGVGRGDVISVQLPNWWEFAVVALAALRVGAVVNPLMPIFRERELSYMLDFAETKVLRRPEGFFVASTTRRWRNRFSRPCRSLSMSSSSTARAEQLSTRRCSQARSGSRRRRSARSARFPPTKWRC